MAPQREREREREREIEDPKQMTDLRRSLLEYKKRYSEALKNGDQATAHYFNRISNQLVISYSARAQLLRLNVYYRLMAEARIKGEYDCAICLLLLSRQPMLMGSTEWFKWMKEAEELGYHPLDPLHDEVSERWNLANLLNLLDRARMLHIMHLDIVRLEATKSGDTMKASAALQAMKEPLKVGSDECTLLIEKAKEFQQRFSPFDCELMITTYPELLQARENGDLAKVNELMHLGELEYLKVKTKASRSNYISWIFYEARIRIDDQHMLPGQLQSSQDWRMFTMGVQRCDRCAMENAASIQAFHISFGNGDSEECEDIEVFLYNNRKTVDDNRAEISEETIREMDNVSAGEGLTRTSDSDLDRSTT